MPSVERSLCWSSDLFDRLPFAPNALLLMFVDVIEHFLSGPGGGGVTGEWAFVSRDAGVLLPCAVPFELASSNLTPARQLYADNELTQALRFVELSRLANSSVSSEQWSLRLISAMLLLQGRQHRDAWRILQSALNWRSRQERHAASPTLVPLIGPTEWLVMATVALGVGEIDTAERYASEAIGFIEDRPSCCVKDVLSDTRADAMTVFATLRLCQKRYQEAEMLLELAHDAYVQAGDMQQLVVSLILLADVEFHSGSTLSAQYLLCECERLLNEECDITRHDRVAGLRHLVDFKVQSYRGTNRRISDISLN